MKQDRRVLALAMVQLHCQPKAKTGNHRGSPVRHRIVLDQAFATLAASWGAVSAGWSAMIAPVAGLVERSISCAFYWVTAERGVRGGRSLG